MDAPSSDSPSSDSPTQNSDAEDTPASSASEADTSKKRDTEVGSSSGKESPPHTQHTNDPTTGVRNNKRKHYLPPQVRKHARPQKQRTCTSSADTPPLNQSKRKRQSQIQIRKPSRPRKQPKGPTGGPQADHPPLEATNITHNRRSIEQLITYIHSTRPTSSATTRRRHRQARVGVEAVSGKRGAVGTATSAHDAPGEDQPTPAHTTDTQHASLHTEGSSRRTLQWTHTTPPPPTNEGRFRGRSPASPTTTTPTHNNTLIHNIPAHHKEKHTTSDTQPQGKRDTAQ